MITKTTPASTQYRSYGIMYDYGPAFDWRTQFSTGPDTISYQEGPKFSSRHLNWKECYHTALNQRSVTGSWSFIADASRTNRGFINFCPPFEKNSNRRIPTMVRAYPECWSKILDQIDLNCADSVLLYSGILQAVPLVGNAFRFVSVMNKAARKLSKSFKKKPFTTVVKTLIQGDFINRFVVRPTIDDARKFLDASNYVVRVMNTAYERSSMPTRYEGEVSNAVTDSGNAIYPFPYSGGGFEGDLSLYYRWRTRTGCSSKIFLLADVSYNHQEIDPIKLWAARCGITKPLDSVWDLVPFSFVIDYFSRAGDFISGLSNEMSSQEGLRGKIQSIYGCWGTTTAFNTIEYEFTHHGSIWNRNGPISIDTGLPFTLKAGSTQFERVPINPWSFGPLPGGFLQWDLSSTRYRTLLELLIQKKL